MLGEVEIETARGGYEDRSPGCRSGCRIVMPLTRNPNYGLGCFSPLCIALSSVTLALEKTTAAVNPALAAVRTQVANLNTVTVPQVPATTGTVDVVATIRLCTSLDPDNSGFSTVGILHSRIP